MYNEEYFEKMKVHANDNKKLVPLVRSILISKPRSVLDVGCGHGYLVKRLLSRGLDAWGMDYSECAGKEIPFYYVNSDAVKKFPFPNKSFDVVVSTDFLEHLTEKEIDFVLSEMRRVGNRIIVQVCCKKEKIGNTHKTIKPIEWWRDKLKGVEII